MGSFDTLEAVKGDRRAEVRNSVVIEHSDDGDGFHVFTSPDLPGLFICDDDLKTAFHMIADAVGAIIQAQTGVKADYYPDLTLEEFEERLENNTPSPNPLRNLHTFAAILKDRDN